MSEISSKALNSYSELSEKSVHLFSFGQDFKLSKPADKPKLIAPEDYLLNYFSESDESEPKYRAMLYSTMRVIHKVENPAFKEYEAALNGPRKPYHDKIQRGYNSARDYTEKEISTIFEYMNTVEGRKVPRSEEWWDSLFSDKRMLGRTEYSISRYVEKITVSLTKCMTWLGISTY